MGPHFYPRSPCGERQSRGSVSMPRYHFYPRSPCGERLKEVEKLSRVTVISIHALLAESDQPRSRKTGRLPPFLSTLSLRRATTITDIDFRIIAKISIHALLAESDRMEPSSTCTKKRFLSTLSLRRATLTL